MALQLGVQVAGRSRTRRFGLEQGQTLGLPACQGSFACYGRRGRRRPSCCRDAGIATGAECIIASAWIDVGVAFQHDGISIAHVVPEALDGGGLASIRTGDWIYLDLAAGEFQVVTHSTRGYKVLGSKELASRPDRKKRINELERRRMDFLPSFRILLDQVSSAESGVSPAMKA